MSKEAILYFFKIKISFNRDRFFRDHYEFHEPHFRLWLGRGHGRAAAVPREPPRAAAAQLSPRRSRVAAASAPPRGRYPRLPPGAAASCSPAARAASPDRSNGGPAWGAEQRRWVGGAEAGPTD